MPQPKNFRGSRLCLTLTKKGLTVYGNPAAFRSLAKWLEWIAHSSPTEHYECHVGMDLADSESKFGNQRPRNVWVLTERSLDGIVEKRRRGIVDSEEVEYRGFDLTFMAVPETELDQMAQFEASGTIPDSWLQSSE